MTAKFIVLLTASLFVVTSCTKKSEEEKKTPKQTAKRANVVPKGPRSGPGPEQTAKSKADMEKFEQMQKKPYTPKAGDLSPEGFNWIHRDLAMVYSRTLYEHNLRGRIHEDSLKKKEPQLDAYIGTLRAINKDAFKKWDKKHQHSFLINAYFAHALKILIAQDFKNLDNKLLDKKNTVELFGKKYSFNEYIKNEIEAATDDPRFFMSLYCFDEKCPELRNRIINFKNMDNMLNVSTTRFFINPEKNVYDEKNKTLTLSPWVKRFRDKFPKKEKEFKAYLYGFFSKKKKFPATSFDDIKITYQ